MNKIFIKLMLFVFTLILVLSFPVFNTSAENKTKALVIYTNEDNQLDENVKMLDMLIGHFTSDTLFKSSTEVTKQDLEDVTHLFYYGVIATELPSKFETLFDDYQNSFVAIGYNSEQLGNQFEFLEPRHEREINQLMLTDKPEQNAINVSQTVLDITLHKKVDTLIEGTSDNGAAVYPVMIHSDNHYFYSMNTLWSDETILFGEILHDVFEVTHDDQHLAYIRLEDVHPLVDPKNVEDIGEILKEKGIPYMIAVIPVYTDPETGEEFHFSDSPKLLKILKKMQKEGASIVLHGYTHQYRSSETGEGFEFWDVENNTPVYTPKDESVHLKSENEFKSKKAYDSYLTELKKYETTYIEEKLTKGIQELVNYGLYPLAFEAPHYTMSQNGYQVASDFFSTYVGQVQLSDQNWRVMDRTPYVTTPSFMGGMELLPETVGYVYLDDTKSITKMVNNMEEINVSNDGVISGFYHPYLGVEGFNELIKHMEKQPNLEWIDLKESDVWVKADNVSIHTESGEVTLETNRSKLIFSSGDLLSYHYFKWSIILSWSLCVVGALAIFSFIIFTFINYNRRKITE